MFTQRSTSRIFAILLVVMVLQMVVAPVRPVFAAATFTVNSTLDQPDDLTIPGTCHTAANTCTLRAAIMQANRSSGAGATIIVPAGIYTLTIPTAGANGEENGDLNMTSPLSGNPVITIIGAGAGTTIIDANRLDSVLRIALGRNASITGVTLRNGYNLSANESGGLYNLGTLILINSTVSDNQGQFGGGIFNGGTLTLNNSTITGNQADSGGGISSINGNLTIVNSTISRNISDNEAGGIGHSGNLIMVNSTISQNYANTDGGGIYHVAGSANIYNTSIVFNSADADANFTGDGGGVYNYTGIGAIFNLRNSLVAGNKTRGLSRDCSGTLNSYGRNLFKSVIDCTVITGSGSWTYIDSLDTIGPLQNNGGSTFTHALLPGSNAIDGADPVLGCVDSNSVLLTSDQRGAARISGVLCDIGAYEFMPPVTLKSISSNDGWILESTETSNAGGTLNASATTFNLGDNAQDKQYRAILHFDTSSLPDNAIITKVTLKIRKQGQVGTNPFTILGGLKVDMRKPYFGTAAGLVASDFQAVAGKTAVATFNATPVSNWYSALLNATGRNYINKTGTTQFRLRFATDDNNDNGADYMKFFSGNYATASYRPMLIIEYYIP